ncbi:MAG: hypothetical protein ACW98K_15255 [Candidatus Kariarchaeaceae archaeon]|jgi:hypothetical protein
MILNKYRLFLLLIVLLFLVVLSCASNNRKSHDKPDAAEFAEGRIPGEYLVTVKEGIGEEYIDTVFAASKVVAVDKITTNLYLIKIEDDPGPSKIYEDYLKDENIDKIQPNYKYEAENGGRKKMSSE